MRDESNPPTLMESEYDQSSSREQLPQKSPATAASNKSAAPDESSRPQDSNGMDAVENGSPQLNGLNDGCTTVNADERGHDEVRNNDEKADSMEVDEPHQGSGSGNQPVLFDVEDDHETEMVKIRENLMEPSPEEDKSEPESFSGRIVYEQTGTIYIVQAEDLMPFVPLKEGSWVEKNGDAPRQAEYPNIIEVMHFYKDNKIVDDSPSTNMKPVVDCYKVCTQKDVDGDKDEDMIIDDNGHDNMNTAEDCQEKANSDGYSCEKKDQNMKPISLCLICKSTFQSLDKFIEHSQVSHDADVLNEENKCMLTKLQAQPSTNSLKVMLQKVGARDQPLVYFLKKQPSNKAVIKALELPMGQENSLTQDDLVDGEAVEVHSPTTSTGGDGVSPPHDPDSNIHSLLQAFTQQAIPISSGSDFQPNLAGQSPLEVGIKNPMEAFLSGSMSSGHGPTGPLLNSLRMTLANGTSGMPPPPLFDPAFISMLSGPLGPPHPLGLPHHPVPPSGANPVPISAASGSASINTPTNASQLQGTTIGPCPEHVTGRQPGVECDKCDFILNSAKMGEVNWALQRGIAKTIKCPKCNWHYKYQETLEVHMKEKHPESENCCIYCITGQQHPRLARGETYTCGYKPYRCEVCNYSTTTKGNLSIHMQSDKHINNMQELQNGGVITTPDGSKISQASLAQMPVAQRLNATHPILPGGGVGSWRCDICNFDANNPRNYRIHLTSEKHLHNMANMSDSMKQLHSFHMLQTMMAAGPGGGNAGNNCGINANNNSLGGNAAGNKPPIVGGGSPPNDAVGGSPVFAAAAAAAMSNQQQPHPLAEMMAEMSYNQALILQLMKNQGNIGGALPGGALGSLPPPLQPVISTANNTGPGSGPIGLDQVGSDMGEPPAEPCDPNPSFAFSCCVCREFATNNVETLACHIAVDRSVEETDSEVSVVIGGIHLCKLCSYKTNLKANFQLHLKTDKHLARLSLLNHIREGGPTNEWKLKYLLGTNPVQLRCNACDFFTNSMHKLQAHTASQVHEVSMILFHHLTAAEKKIPEKEVVFSCTLCQFSTREKAMLLQHAKTFAHLRAEQLSELKRLSEAGPDRQTNQQSDVQPPNIGDIFTVTEAGENDVKETPEAGAQANKTNDGKKENDRFTCPLCQEKFADTSSLEAHADQVHQVNKEGLARLIVLMEGCHWLNNSSSNQTEENCLKTPSKSEADPNQQNNLENNFVEASLQNKAEEEELRNKSEKGQGDSSKDEKMDNGEEREGSIQTPTSSIIGAISEKHLYKFRCGQCSLAFKTKEKLEVHAQYHQIRDITKCKICERNFRSIQALLKHVDLIHMDGNNSEELMSYRQSLLTHPLMSLTQHTIFGDASEIEEEKTDGEECVEGEGPSKNPDSGLVIREQQPMTPTSSTNKQSFRFDKTMTYSLEKYMDPKRPFKCDVCKESFTQKNILLVHFNSVSHLHKVKKSMKEQQQMVGGGEMTPLTPKSDQGSSPNLSSPSTSMTHQNVRGSALMSVLGNLNARKQLELDGSSQDDEPKPYKCNICKVSYSQSSTLDIHIRSLMHHTRTTKLQELVMNGCVDLSKPLIENPDHDVDALKMKNLGGDLLSPRSLSSNSSMMSNQKTPTTPNDSNQCNNSPTGLFTTSTPKSLTEVFENNQSFGNESEINKEKNVDKTDIGDNDDDNEENRKQRPDETQPGEEIPQADDAELTEEKRKSQVFKSLLQNYGFELVMQFNESHQRMKKMEKEKLEQLKDANKNDEVVEEAHSKGEINPENIEETMLKNPGFKISSCPICNKEFSSIWVLKAHTEEEHNVMIPQEFVQKYVEELKSNIDSEHTKTSKDSSPEVSGLIIPRDIKSLTDDPEKKANDSPSRGLEQGSYNKQNASLKDDFYNMITNMNSNMNLHPPLIPGMPPTSLMQTPNSRFPMPNSGPPSSFENQILSKLGIDPEIVRQAGVDPKLLIHLANMDPKAPLDPRVLAMFSTAITPHNSQMMNANCPPNNLNQKMLQLSMESKFGLMGSFPPGFPIPEMLMSSQQKTPTPFPEGGQRRARTRITDDQLKILRANFDINNSPSEDQINNLTLQTGLPPKVIKHWFRNTLFKERQKNKDSPYNFSNPPSTMLNLEEYEKTGEPKVIHLNEEDQEKSKSISKHSFESDKKDDSDIEKTDSEDNSIVEVKHDPENSRDGESFKLDELRKLQKSLALRVSVSPPDESVMNGNSIEGLFSPQMNPLDRHLMIQSPIPPGFPNPLSFFPGPMAPGLFNTFGCLRNTSPLGDHSMSHSSAKRANRTRFTDYQIKVLQEFFENNAYPKDDDLEYLSKLLALSPRVIVVWFQNARQKARKIYENQPPVDPHEEGAGRFTRTPGLNYQCKKCLLVFQRYYELIRHQKQHCFKEEDAKRSAIAQRAAAQAAAQFVGHANMNLNSAGSPSMQRQDGESAAILREHNLVSPMSSSNDGHPSGSSEEGSYNPSTSSSLHRLMEEKKHMGTIFEKRNQEDRVMKYLNEAQVNMLGRYPTNSHLALLQKQGMTGVEEAATMEPTTILQQPTNKRKSSEDIDDVERDENGQPKDKRLRTTILPEQLDYLYQKYQVESNPSRKMLEQIAAEVGLRKRVVQVWFQNTRARERKGQFRAHQQVINKRCPFCPALFKVRSALESHLATKHAAQFARGEINIDSLPDATADDFGNAVGGSQISGRSTLFPSIPPPLSPTSSSSSNMPPLIPNTKKSSEFEASMRKYYEETMKQFITDVKLGQQDQLMSISESRMEMDRSSPIPLEGRSNQALDLSSPPLKFDDKSFFEGTDIFILESEDDQGFHVIVKALKKEESEGNLTEREKEQATVRARISQLQMHLLKLTFEMIKELSPSEYQKLESTIGLPEVVIEAWFANARKKMRQSNDDDISLYQSQEISRTFLRSCKICNLNLSDRIMMRDHLFDQTHLDRMKSLLDAGHTSIGSSAETMNQQKIRNTSNENAGQSSIEESDTSYNEKNTEERIRELSSIGNKCYPGTSSLPAGSDLKSQDQSGSNNAHPEQDSYHAYNFPDPLPLGLTNFYHQQGYHQQYQVTSTSDALARKCQKEEMNGGNQQSSFISNQVASYPAEYHQQHHISVSASSTASSYASGFDAAHGGNITYGVAGGRGGGVGGGAIFPGSNSVVQGRYPAFPSGVPN